ncbi:MAG: FAD-dependent oxidoreductase [Hamadaea sp.]|uniref:FAD-dependent oxidoreductase n=1 Tax=Hamadaea sp. TaxID=2024425 RepID=UPI0017C09920|nr:FAD-dependent oxidoreductase [Hamadaea sp.]NUR70526.1 FAD-dependent oxidoreductase [Hamadaea sp.]NUT18133.1 FAD-dependent oxidoreductase [Hamadaea sp.]
MTSPLPGLRYHLPAAVTSRVTSADVVVYGATSGGVTAAVRAARDGRSVTLLAFDDHVGGLSSGGLGETDVGRASTVGGLAQAFYRAVGAAYGVPDVHWRVESHVAESIFVHWLADAGVTVLHRQHLSGVAMSGSSLAEIRTDDGGRHQAKVFVDASYEGDLMAAAGVSHAIGREASAVYGEPLAGVQPSSSHQFTVPVDPYVVPGRPASGLLPGVSADAYGTIGDGDERVQAYNFRLHVTDAAGRLPYPEPDGYDPGRYELLRRYVEAGVFELYGRTTRVHGDVFDMNNHGAFSSDHIGANYAWPSAVSLSAASSLDEQAAAAATGYALREEIFADHVRYQAGLLHYLCFSRSLPSAVRSAAQAYGLAPGEFGETSLWPHQLYIREARRMVSDYVITQHDAASLSGVDDPVALASYVMDSHNAKRVVVDGRPVNEGNVQQPLAAPMGVPYRALVPRTGECSNLLVASAISASHVAFASVRMEPVFMMLGEAAGCAAGLAAATGSGVRDVDYETLRKELLAGGAILSGGVR